MEGERPPADSGGRSGDEPPSGLSRACFRIVSVQSRPGGRCWRP